MSHSLLSETALAGRWLCPQLACPQLASPASHRDISLLLPSHTGQLSLGDNANHPLASEVWVQPLGERQIGGRTQEGREETLEVHTGMKNLWFFLLPQEASTT